MAITEDLICSTFAFAASRIASYAPARPTEMMSRWRVPVQISEIRPHGLLGGVTHRCAAACLDALYFSSRAANGSGCEIESAGPLLDGVANLSGDLEIFP